MNNNEPKRKIKKIDIKDNDLTFKAIVRILEKEDPTLDEPVICEFENTRIYEAEYGAPPNYETHYMTVGQEARRSGIFPLTTRELDIIRLVGISEKLFKDYKKDQKAGIITDEEVIYQKMTPGYHSTDHNLYSTVISTKIKEKPTEKLTDLDKTRLVERKAKIEEIKNDQNPDLDKKGLLTLIDTNLSTYKKFTAYELEVTAREAALLSGILLDSQFKTYEQIKEEKKSSISFESIKKAINKALGKDVQER